MKRRKIDSALISKGFERNEGSKHILYSMEIEGKIAVVTRMSRGSSHHEIGKKILSKMAKQLHISNQQFLEYIECKYTYKEYYSYVKKNYL